MTTYRKEDDYTLLATSDVPGGGTLCRYFNFAAQQVTTLYTQRAELKGEVTKQTYSSGNFGVSQAVSVALTSQMQVQKFSDLDSLAEVELMRAELVSRGGKPPELDTPDKQKRPGISRLG